jgi:uncharacterized membrane protein
MPELLSPRDEVRGSSAAWGEPSKPETRWIASMAMLSAVLLYVALPGKFTVGPSWLLPVIELAVLVPLTIVAPKRGEAETRLHRAASVTLIGLVSAANLTSLVLLVMEILQGTKAEGTSLVLAAIQIWVTNVIVFGLWYWELDRGGPAARSRSKRREPDFLFPQMSTPGAAPRLWYPTFLDYLYVAFTNATAFSPTDTMPLTVWAKMLMLVQSLASLLTVALVAARAVNILS